MFGLFGGEFEIFFDYDLGGNPCVIRTWYPESVFATHTCISHQRILERNHKSMTHMQSPRDIGWR